MPITLQQLASNRASTVIDFGGGATLTIEYYPQRITGQMLADFAALDTIKTLSNDRAIAVMTGVTDILLTVLASWDLVESLNEDGTPGPSVPLDREHVAALGLAIQIQILSSILEAMQRTGESSAPGGNGSANVSPSGATSSAPAV